jgi:16S rRNA (cytosine1402-N4)-methyltransferase
LTAMRTAWNTRDNSAGATPRPSAETTAARKSVVVMSVPSATAELSRVFQAVRIAVNHELDILRAFLDGVLDVLNPGGRLVVMSYHSLEDRMVKMFLRDASATCVCPPSVPLCVCNRVPRIELLTRRAARASDAETASNPRARSATLRAASKVGSGNRVAGERVQ